MVDIAVRPEPTLDGANSFEVFRNGLSETFVPVCAESGDAKTFRGTVTFANLGPLRLAQISADAHVTRRTERLIRRSDPDYYKLTLQTAGSSVLSQGGRDTALTPGDLAIYDTTRPYDLRLDGPFGMVVLMFPRSLLNVPERSLRLITGQRIPGDRPLPRLIGPFVTGLTQHTDNHVPETNRLLCDALLDMLAAALADELGIDTSPSPGPRQAAMLHRIKTYIDDQLSDPDLDPTAIAAAHHISPRYLRKLFEAEGDSVSRWIRRRRLENCHRDLAEPTLFDKSVTAVASRWAFTDAAHFSRLFRSTFGESPREYRQSARGSTHRVLQKTA
jgi:AraC-like DNA-binding protein